MISVAGRYLEARRVEHFICAHPIIFHHNVIAPSAPPYPGQRIISMQEAIFHQSLRRSRWQGGACILPLLRLKSDAHYMLQSHTNAPVTTAPQSCILPNDPPVCLPCASRQSDAMRQAKWIESGVFM